MNQQVGTLGNAVRTARKKRNLSQEVGDRVTVTTVGTPGDIKFQTGIKDPHQVMRYAEGSGEVSHTFSISIKGRYYFFVTNMDGSRDLDIIASILR